MKEITLYQIDAFTDTLFKGNPAAVCPLPEWISEEKMQAIALENNLSETAFYVKKGNAFEIRWFTPTTEVDLCGHATLASAYVLFFIENYKEDTIFFKATKHELTVTKKGSLINLNFPKNLVDEIAITLSLIHI